MQLDNTQRAKVSEWIQQGLKVAEVQTRLLSEFGIKMTYMEVRFLIDDLKVTPVDPEPEPAPAAQAAQPAPGQPAEPQPEPQPPGGISISMDQVTRPGALVSGKVVFSDGQRADWYLDEVGRLGLAPQQQGYRPSQGDIQQFQAALHQELSKLGF